jgi:hypothetical protein
MTIISKEDVEQTPRNEKIEAVLAEFKGLRFCPETRISFTTVVNLLAGCRYKGDKDPARLSIFGSVCGAFNGFDIDGEKTDGLVEQYLPKCWAEAATGPALFQTLSDATDEVAEDLEDPEYLRDIARGKKTPAVFKSIKATFERMLDDKGWTISSSLNSQDNIERLKAEAALECQDDDGIAKRSVVTRKDCDDQAKLDAEAEVKRLEKNAKAKANRRAKRSK